MLDLRLGAGPLDHLRVLAIGAHPDDIEIGCAGTIMRLLAEHPVSDVRWVVLSGSGPRANEARASAEDIVGREADLAIDLHDFRDGHFPYLGSPIKDAFESLKAGFDPDLILTHRREDLHQDHRLVADVTWQTFRQHLILEYEVPKYDGDLGAPNVFAEVDAATCERKIRYITRCYATQRAKPWFTAE